MAEAVDVVPGTPQPGTRNITPLRRAVAAVPVSIVVFFVTLLFTSVAATQRLEGDVAAVTLVPAFSSVVIGTVVVVVLLVAYAFTLGTYLDRRLSRLPKVVVALVFAVVGLGAGLAVSAALVGAVSLVDGVERMDVFVALLLVLCVPAGVSGFCTHMVVDASSESRTELLLAFALAAAAIALFWWSVAG